MKIFGVSSPHIKTRGKDAKKDSKLQNIIITGFMGTGKTTIGEALAQSMGWTFVDFDALIEAREGITVRQIFETRGESYFRQLESEICIELNAWHNTVIATGGGTLVNPQNLTAVSARNLVVCLDCAPDVLWQRLAESATRPMLDADDRQLKLMALFTARKPAYDRIPQHVDTGVSDKAKIVAEIEMLWKMTNDE